MQIMQVVPDGASAVAEDDAAAVEQMHLSIMINISIQRRNKKSDSLLGKTTDYDY